MDVWFALPYGPFLIFAMRIVDVSIGTLRLMFMVRGRRFIASGMGFVEVLVWIIAVGSAMEYLTSPYHLAGYAGGFAMGTFVGVSIERTLALGQVVLRVILPDGDGAGVASTLRDAGYAVTEVDGRGRDGPVDIANVVVGRRYAHRVAELVEEAAPRSFITIEEIRSTRRGLVDPVIGNARRHVRK